MKHSIRQRVINQYGLPVVKIEQVNGELGSGVFDCNGREIFEGDIVVVKQYPKMKIPVTFAEGIFYATVSSTQRVMLGTRQSHELEIVGRVDD